MERDKGIVDDVISFTPAHLEQVLGGFGDNGAQAANEDDIRWIFHPYDKFKLKAKCFSHIFHFL